MAGKVYNIHGRNEDAVFRGLIVSRRYMVD